jgi:acetolactate synthase regulatory subunit
MLRSVTFDLLADAEPGLLPRVLVPFARRDLTPDQIKARRVGDAMEASLHVAAMPAEMVHLVEGNLRQIVGVRRVEVVLRGVVREAA